MLEKIKPEELVGKGVIGLPDTPKLTAEEMQKKFEETAREVIVPKYNALGLPALFPGDIPDAVIFNYYSGIYFVNDDFCCTAGR